MSDMARKARLALKAKAKSLAGEKDTKVDSSDWTQAEPLNADVKTGARPISRRAFKKGGKVVGEKAKANMGRKPRAAGGMSPKAYADAKINRNVKDANEEREGKKHIGGFKKGGRTHREDGGGVMPSPEEKAKTPSQFIVVDPDGTQYGGVYSSRSRANRAMDKRDNEYGAYRYRVKEITPKAKGGRTRRQEGGQVDQYDREALKKLIERESTGVKPRGESREVEASDLYTPEQLKRLEAGRKKGGRTKREEGGRTGMRSESTEYAKKSRAADEEYKNAQEKYFKGGMKNWEESGGYEDKHGQYHSRKKGGRAKKQAGGAMMMDPRLGMVSPRALEFTNGSMVPGLKKGGKVKAGASFDEMRSKFGTQVMKKGGKAHGDEAMDKALIKKMVKKEARTGRASGGRQSFNSAFAEARKNGMDLFEWNGKKYNTKLAEGPKNVPLPPSSRDRPGADIGTGERPEQSGRELMNEPPRRRTTTINETDAMGSPTGMTREVEAPRAASEESGMINRLVRETPLSGWGSRYRGWSERDSSEGARKKGGRAKRACGGYAGGGMAEEGGKRGKKGSGKTNINIVIAAGKPADQQQMQQPPAGPPPGMMPPPPAPQGGAPMPPPEMMAGMGAPPMGRKRGGRAGYAAGGQPVTTTTTARPVTPTTTTTTRPAAQRGPVSPNLGTTAGPGGGRPAPITVQPPIMPPSATPKAPGFGIGGPNPGRPAPMPIRDPGFGNPQIGQPGIGNPPMVKPGFDAPMPGVGRPGTVVDVNRPGAPPQIGQPGIGGMPIRDPGFGYPQMGGPKMPIASVPMPMPIGTGIGREPGFGSPQLDTKSPEALAALYQQFLAQQQVGAMPRKSGGRVTKVAKSYQDMEAGAGSGEGRLQKTDIAKRLPKKQENGENVYEGRGYPNKVLGATGGRTARKTGGKTYGSYKDMDAGAGSGEGRLEKTEIQKRKR